MKYINADIILPEELLKEVQKYVQGKMVYIPKPEGLRKKWGENSGSRAYLKNRNEEIRRKFTEGASMTICPHNIACRAIRSRKSFIPKTTSKRKSH